MEPAPAAPVAPLPPNSKRITVDVEKLAIHLRHTWKNNPYGFCTYERFRPLTEENAEYIFENCPYCATTHYPWPVGWRTENTLIRFLSFALCEDCLEFLAGRNMLTFAREYASMRSHGDSHGLMTDPFRCRWENRGTARVFGSWITNYVKNSRELDWPVVVDLSQFTQEQQEILLKFEIK